MEEWVKIESTAGKVFLIKYSEISYFEVVEDHYNAPFIWLVSMKFKDRSILVGEFKDKKAALSWIEVIKNNFFPPKNDS